MLSSKYARFWCLAAPLKCNVNVCTRVRVLYLYLNRAWDTYDGVL